MSELLRLLAINLLVITVYMSIWFVLSLSKKRLDLVDTAWGGGFIVIAYGCFLHNPSFYTLLTALLVAAWGARLMLHIYRRNRDKDNDPRYEALSAKWAAQTFWLRAYVSIFLLQGVLIVLISLPVTVLALPGSHHHPLLVALGVIVWFAGVSVETAADAQLSRFLRQRTADQKVMDKGLWGLSRHPNYFGEVLGWWGIGIIAIGAPYSLLAWLGPLTITYLIVYVSGIPPLEKRKKDDPAYQAYAARTSRFIPLPPKK